MPPFSGLKRVKLFGSVYTSAGEKVIQSFIGTEYRKINFVDTGVWLPELGDRFFKLTLQLFNRYAAWINIGLGHTASGVSSGVSVNMLISNYLSSLSPSASPSVWSSLTGQHVSFSTPAYRDQ